MRKEKKDVIQDLIEKGQLKKIDKDFEIYFEKANQKTWKEVFSIISEIKEKEGVHVLEQVDHCGLHEEELHLVIKKLSDQIWKAKISFRDVWLEEEDYYYDE